MAGIDKEILARPIRLVDRVLVNADSALSFKQQCIELKTIAVKLGALLREAAHDSNELYQRPALRIIDDVEKVLDNALALVTKCRLNTCMMRILFFIIIPPDAFKETSTQLENSIHNVSWLLHVSTPAKARLYEYYRLPPIVSKKPRLARIWVDIGILHIGTLEERCQAAASLLALNFNHDWGLTVEEGGIAPLLKLAEEGPVEGQEKAVRSIGFMCRDSKSVEHIVGCGACPVFAKNLEDGHVNVQSAVASAVSKMVAHHPKCQDDFVKNNVIRLLINNLAFESVGERDLKQQYESIPRQIAAAVALRNLCKGNVNIFSNITDHSKTLLCFSFLLEKGLEDVKYYSAMALMEITAMAEQNAELRQSGFKPTLHGVKAVVEQLLKVVENKNYDLLISSIKSIGHLAWTFKATETRMIASLVRLLDKRLFEDVVIETVIALDKFACPDNFLHENHCKAIVEGGGTKHLIQIVQFGELVVQIPSLILLCHIILHVHDSEMLTQEEVLTTLEKSSKNAKLMEEPNIQSLLLEAKSRMEFYQSKGSK